MPTALLLASSHLNWNRFSLALLFNGWIVHAMALAPSLNQSFPFDAAGMRTNDVPHP